jgi:hypothetical protein
MLGILLFYSTHLITLLNKLNDDKLDFCFDYFQTLKRVKLLFQLIADLRFFPVIEDLVYRSYFQIRQKL